MTLPNFLIIGAAKSGTTALYHYLRQHPEIFLSEPKEPRFFAFEGQELSYRGPGDDRYQKQIIAHFDDYRRLFASVGREKAIGEISPLYLSQPQAAEKIAARIPDVRLIAILRDPADRAYAQFLMHRRDGHEPLTDFAAALAAEDRRIRENWLPIWYYRERGFYFQQLSRYYERFSPARIRVFLYEDFVGAPLSVIRNICEFLEVRTDFKPDMSFRPNRSRIPRSQLFNRALVEPHPIKILAEKILPQNLRDRFRNSLLEFNSRLPPPLDRDLRRQLIADYRNDILQLQKLLGRDLSDWLEP